MKSSPRSRRHRNPHSNEEQQQQQSPFFTKANDVPVQQKPEPFFNTKAGPVQAKLAIGQPGDKYEQEADAVADAVVNQPAAASGVQQKGKGIQRATLASPEKDEKFGTAEGRMAEDKTIQEKPEEEEAVQKMDAPKEEEEPVQKMDAPKEEEEPVQKMDAPKEEEPVQKMDAPKEEEEPVQKMDAPKEEEEPVQKMDAPKEEEEPVQKMDAPKEEEEAVQKKGAEEEEEPVQAKAASNGPAAAPISSRLKDSKGKGRPLSGKTRQEMESGIGADFGGVRLHTDDEAVGLNEALRAQAFTNGRDVYFNKGKYNPETAEGKRLLAHELTHVVQQGEAGSKGNVPQNNAHSNSQAEPLVQRKGVKSELIETDFIFQDFKENTEDIYDLKEEVSNDIYDNYKPSDSGFEDQHYSEKNNRKKNDDLEDEARAKAKGLKMWAETASNSAKNIYAELEAAMHRALKEGHDGSAVEMGIDKDYDPDAYIGETTALEVKRIVAGSQGSVDGHIVKASQQLEKRDYHGRLGTAITNWVADIVVVNPENSWPFTPAALQKITKKGPMTKLLLINTLKDRIAKYDDSSRTIQYRVQLWHPAFKGEYFVTI